MPPAPSMTNPNIDAKTLREAMKGLGTNDKALIEIIANRSNEQLQEIRACFKNEFGRDLIDDVKSETSGDYEKLVVGLLYTRAEFDAKMLNGAMKGAGTDEEMLIDVLAHRTPAEVEAIKEAYLRLYGKTLEHDLAGDLGGKLEKLFLALVANKGAERPLDEAALQATCEQLYQAGQGRWGTDEVTFIDILTKSGDRFLRALNYKYAQLHGDSLMTAVEKEMGGHLAKTLKAILTSHDEYYADVIFASVDGMGTNDKRLINAIVGRRHVLRGINEVFVHKYGKHLKKRVEQECSGNYKKAMVDVLDDL